MPHFPVFMSYAQLDRNRHLEKFVDEFREQLRASTGGADATALAFFDRDLKAGDPWSAEILAAVNAADVLLCLMSPTYFNREWCGRELETFLRRQSHLPPAAAHARFIFPVWWQVPPAPRQLPKRLGVYHHRDAQYPRDYERFGLRGLARNSLWKQFRQVADRLAKLIAETLAQPHRLPPGQLVADVIEIANAFDEQQPYDVRMVALTTGGDAWLPSAADVTVGIAGQETAQSLAIFVRRVETGPGLIERLEQAQAEEQIILVVADAAALPEIDFQRINEIDLPNLALLLVDTGTPAVGADSWLGRFPDGTFMTAKTAGLMRVAGAGEMRAQMERLVDETRRRLQAAAPTARAEDRELAENARAQGISVDVQPNLTGPGAGSQP